jgi:hypothetical protein
MGYSLDAHRRMEELAGKYGAWLVQAGSDQEAGRPILNADGVVSTLSECYRDALVTAEALYAYLVAEPETEDAPSPLARPVDVVDASAG